MNKNIIKTAICQMQVEKDKDDNLKKARVMIREASVNGADMVVLPEMFNCPYDINLFKDYAETSDGKTVNMLSELAGHHSILIIGGSIPEKDAGRIYNTCFIVDKNGDLIARHRKIHLFDVDIEGGISFKESKVISSGKTPTVFDTSFCRMGVMICYDMRFTGLAEAMSEKGAKIMIVPAAFNMTTGPAHWHLITRARALDNQVFFIAASPARNLKASYTAYGHSICIDPWGEIISEASTDEKIIYCDIRLKKIEKVRSELPVLKHKRKDKYGV